MRLGRVRRGLQKKIHGGQRSICPFEKDLPSYLSHARKTGNPQEEKISSEWNVSLDLYHSCRSQARRKNAPRNENRKAQMVGPLTSSRLTFTPAREKNLSGDPSIRTVLKMTTIGIYWYEPQRKVGGRFSQIGENHYAQT